MSATLNINGQTTINKASWDIHMEDINVTSGSVTATTVPTLDTAKTTVNFSVKLTNPGNFYEFTVKEVNKGTIDAMVSTISKTGLTATQAKYLDYIVTYSDGTALAEKQLLKSNQSETLKVRIAFKKDLIASDLPIVDTTLNLNFSISYQQADDSAVAIVHPPICKRATVLHNDGTNTYGNLGTQGTLTSGDAFDCDVNGDGVYDPNVERFYYVSGKDGDSSSNYATLIYYNNVSGGVPDSDKRVEHSSGGYIGPTIAMLELPTTTQWKNVKLSNTTRNITDENGTVRVNDFSYAGYAARLLTYQEVYSGCYDGSKNLTDNQSLLSKCMYLTENKGSYWLENPTSYLGAYTWAIMVHYVANHGTIGSPDSVRPAIEVLKSKILY